MRQDSICSTLNVVNITYFKKFKKEGIRSTVSRKRRLSNNRSHIKKNIPSCKIATNFTDKCYDEGTP